MLTGEDPEDVATMKRAKNRQRRARRQTEFKMKKWSKWCRGCDKTLDLSEFDFGSGDVHRACTFILDSISTIATAQGAQTLGRIGR